MQQNIVPISKFLSLVLRHQPEALGIQLDENGWTSVTLLLEKMKTKFGGFNQETLEYVVANNNKKRFAFNADKTKIRASQGHSVEVDLGLPPAIPPTILYHGTGEQNLTAIKQGGLEAGRRTHVHLSADTDTAKLVGSRKGRPVVITIDAEAMHRNGQIFFRSDNGVWLTKEVPPQYLIHFKS